MKKTTIISTVNTKVVDYIKKGMTDKKEMHKKMIESIDPKVIQNLKSMKKIVG